MSKEAYVMEAGGSPD
jgi:regulator of protease activity HflC (stomatin/prohibitin superfamily)